MADNIPLEFENIGEYNRAVLQQLINNNALLRILVDYEVEKHAHRLMIESNVDEDYEKGYQIKKNEITQNINEKIREYKLHALADINLRK